MSLSNVGVVGGALEASGDNAEAVSKQIVQEAGANISKEPLNEIATDTHTSATSASGTVTASSVTGDQDPYKAFNGIKIGNGFLGGFFQTNVTLTYNFTIPKTIFEFNLYSNTATDNVNPSHFRLHGSQDNATWTLLKEVSGLLSGDWVDGVARQYTIDSPEEYKYYRLTIVDNTGASYCGIGEIEYIENTAYSSSSMDTLKTDTPITDGDRLVIIKEDSSEHEIVVSGVTGTAPYVMDTSAVTQGETPSKVYFAETFDSVFKAIRNISAELEFANISESIVTVPLVDATGDHSSNTVSNPQTGVCSSTAGIAWKVFDKTTALNEFLPYTKVVSITYTFDTPIQIENARGLTSSKGFPDDFTFEGSHNGVDWVTLHTKIGFYWGLVVYEIFEFTNKDAYKYYKFSITGTRDNQNIELRELWYEANDGIPDYNLLRTNTAITDGDKLAIVKDDNSIHEVVASGVVVIGGDTFVNAVPDMTSNIVPIGVALAQSEGGTTDAYNCMDREANTHWSSAGFTPSWVQYKFDGTEIVTRYGLKSYQSQYALKDWTLEASNTGVWGGEQVVLDTQVGQNVSISTVEYFNFSNSVAYKYYRINVTGLQTNNYVRIITFELLSQVPPDYYKMDTTAITAGEIPLKTYKLDGGLEFNSVPATNPVDSLSFDTALKSTRTFDDVKIAEGRILETKVKLSIAGNKLIGLTADIFKKI